MANLVTRIIISASDQASNVFDSIRANAGKLATAVAGYFGVKFFTASVDSAREFEAAMSRVAAASGATVEELAALKSAAEEAGASTQYTSVEAAAALENLAKAGLTATDAVATLPAVLDLATAGGVDLATSSDFISKAVAGMGLAFTDAGRVADVLAKGANASNTSVTGLAQALSYAAPLANSLGLSLEQTVAIIGKFADAGIDASRAGTALNSILAQFSDPASKFRQELASAGIITGDFDQALRQLAAAGPAGQKAILAVGQEAGPALRALLNQGIDSLDKLKSQLDDAAGSARTFAGVMSNNLDGASKGLGSAWEALKIKLGEPVLGPLKEQVDLLATGLREFVGNGTASRFGDAIASAFRAGAGWVKNFVAEFDFAAASAQMQSFATQVTSYFDDIRARAGDAAIAARDASAWAGVVFNSLKLGLQTLTVGITLVQERANALYSAILGGAASAAESLSKITFGGVSDGYADAAAKIRAEIDSLAISQAALIKSSDESFAAMNSTAEDLFRAYEKTKKSADETSSALAAPLDSVADAATGATTAVDGLSSSAKSGAVDAKSLAAETDLLGKSMADMGVSSQTVAAKLADISAKTGVTVKSTRDLRDAVADGYIYFNEASGAWQRGTTNLENLTQTTGNADKAMQAFGRQVGASSAAIPAIGQQSDIAAAKISALRAEYDRFVAAGDTRSAAGVQEKIDGLKRIGAEAGNAADDVNAAFDRLGITSSAAMQKVVDSALRDFDIIRNSGEGTALDIQRAFTAYAEIAIEANGGVASAALKAQAGMYGIRIEATESGSKIAKAMEIAAEATNAVGKSADVAGRKYQQLSQQMEANQDLYQRWRAEVEQSQNTLTEQRSGGSASLLRLARKQGIQVDTDDVARFEDLASDEIARRKANLDYTKISGSQDYVDTINRLTNDALQAAANRVRAENKEDGGAGGRQYNVRIELPGSTTRTIATKSDEDAQALLAFLEELQRRTQP